MTSHAAASQKAAGTATEGSAAAKVAAPDPEDPRKPESPPDLPARSWRYTARTAAAEFQRDGCLDMAAALTFHAVTAIFPAFIVVVALVGVFGRGPSTADAVVGLLDDLGQPDVAEQLRDPITRLATSQTAGLALVLGVLAGLWSASGYVGAFGRAMNRIYEVDEGRPFWKLRPVNLVITVVALLAAGLVVLGLTITGPVARELGARIGLSETAVSIWSVAKWPAVLAIVVCLVALLYHATPNVRQPRFRWISVGAAFAIFVWILSTVGFGVYVANFGSYDRTYGSLAGVIVLLMWLWLTNIALLLGAEIDAELERARQLEGGIAAEETIQLPPRDTTASTRSAAKLAAQIEHGRSIRRRATSPADAASNIPGQDELDEHGQDRGEDGEAGPRQWALLAVLAAATMAISRVVDRRTSRR